LTCIFNVPEKRKSCIKERICDSYNCTIYQ
jgi:hypothetical protein